MTRVAASGRALVTGIGGQDGSYLAERLLADGLEVHALALATDGPPAHCPPEVVLLPQGAFAAWMRAQGKLGGQHKVPRVIADPGRFAAVEAAAIAVAALRAAAPTRFM